MSEKFVSKAVDEKVDWLDVQRIVQLGRSAVRIPVVEKCGTLTTLCTSISAGLLPFFFKIVRSVLPLFFPKLSVQFCLYFFFQNCPFSLADDAIISSNKFFAVKLPLKMLHLIH